MILVLNVVYHILAIIIFCHICLDNGINGKIFVVLSAYTYITLFHGFVFHPLIFTLRVGML